MSTKVASLINKLVQTFGVQIIRTETLRTLEDAFYGTPLSEKIVQDKFSTLELQNQLNELSNRLAHLENTKSEETIQNLVRYAMATHWRTVDLLESNAGLHTPTECPLCNTSFSSSFKTLESQSIFQGGKLIRHQCCHCDVIFGPQKMLNLDDSMLDLEYRNLYRVYSEGNTTDSTIRTFNLLNPKKNGVYLDFGCGGIWSEAIDKLRCEGWDIYGFEPSAPNSSEFVFSSWDEVRQLKFDGIISHNVLEHLIDPIKTNSELAELLKQDGKIIHATPCFEYLYEFSHLHVFFFLGKSAETLARRSGLKITDWVRDGEYIACEMTK